MSQTSRLSIVVDTSMARQKLIDFTAQLKTATTAATNLAAQLRAPMGAAGANTARTSLAGLTAQAAKAQLQQDKLTQSAAKTAIQQQKLAQEVIKTSIAQNNLARSAQAVVIGNQRAEASARRAASGITALSSATNTLNRNWANINLSARTFTPATEAARALSVQINSVTAAAARVTPAANSAAAGLNNLNSASQRADRSARGLHGTMNKLYTVLNSGLVAVTGLGFIKTAAEMQNLSNQIRLVTKDEREYAAVKQQVIGIANKNYNSIAATTSLYQKSARALGNLGKTQQEALQFTNAISTAMRVGGRSAGEQAAALLQLGQAMGAGVIMGDEFRSISENAPILLSLVAKRMGVMQGELKKMSAEGLITAEIMYDAVVENEKMLEDIAKGMPITMGQAFVLVKNKYTETLDDMMNKTGGFSDKLSGLMVGVTKNFDTIINTIKVAGVLAFVGFAGSVNVATKAVAAFNFVMGLNPLVRIAMLVMGVASAFYGLDDVMETTSIVFSDLMSLIGTGLSGIMEVAGDAVDYMSGKFQEGANNGDTAYQGFFDNTEKGFLGFIQGTSRTIAAASAVIVSFWQWLGSGMWDIVKGVGNAFIWLFNKVKSTFSSMGEVLNDALNDVMGRYDKLVGKANSVLDFVKSPLKFKVVGEIEWRDPKYKDTPYLTINDKSMQSFIPKNLDFFMPLVNEKYFENTGQQINNRRNPADLSGNISTGLIDPNSPAGMAATKAREAAAIAEKEAAKEKNKGKGGKPDSNQMMVYKAWKNAGLSDNQARIITAEVGRENDYASKYLFGGHTDPKNKKLNLGMISWQDTREKDLRKYLADMGLIKGNSIEKSQRGLDAQAMFAVNEMMTNKRYSRTKEQFLANPDIGYNEGTEVLGNNYIAWAYKNKKYASGHTRRDKHYNRLNLELGSPDVSKELMADNKAIEAAMKERADILKDYESTPEKIERELGDRLTRISDAGFGEAQEESLIGKAIEMANRESLIYTKSLNDLADANDDFRKTELEKIEKNRENLKFEANIHPFLSLPENEALLKKVLEDIDYAMDYEVAKDKIKNDRLIDDLYAFKKTERQVFEDEWKSRLAEAETMTDEIKFVRIEALKEELALRDKLLGISEKKSLLELKKPSMGEGAYLKQVQDLELERIALSNESPEKKSWLGQQARQPLGDAVTAIMDKINPINPLDKLKQDYEAQLEIVTAYESQYTNILAENSAERKAIEEAYQMDRAQLILAESGALFGSLASASKSMLGEQSSTYRTMFALQQSFVMASAGISMYKAISDAMAEGATLTQKFAAAGVIAAEFSTILGAVSAMQPKGFKQGGYTGNMGASQVAGVVHGQEYVFDAQATKRIGVDNLNAMRSGKSVGGGDVNINVNVDAKGNAQVSGDNERMGRDMANGIKAVVIDTLRKEKRQGGMLYA